MGQTEGKEAKSTQHHAAEGAESGARDPAQSTQPTTEARKEDAGNTGAHNTVLNTNTPPNSEGVRALKSNAEVLRRSTDELVDGIGKLGANILSTAKGASSNIANKVPYTNYSVSAFKKAATVVEDAIVTVKAGITKTDEEPELEAVAKMALFFPLIRSSVPIAEFAKGLPVQKTTIGYLDPKNILVSLVDYQRFIVVTTKMISARQTELINKVKDSEMSSGRKAVFTLAMSVTDMRHFNTQFSEVARFHSNMERTKQSINDILGMFEKLNAILPPSEQLESFPVFAASNPTLNSHSSQKFSMPSSHSSLNYASMNFPTSHSSGGYSSKSSHSSGKFSSHSSLNYTSLASLMNNPNTASPITTHTTNLKPTTNTTNSDATNPAETSTTNSTNPGPTDSKSGPSSGPADSAPSDTTSTPTDTNPTTQNNSEVIR